MIKLYLELSKIETMTTGGCKMVCRTSELKPEHMAELFHLKELGQIAAAFQGIEKDSGKDIKVSEIPKEGKSPSKRLRNVLYRLWEESDRTMTDEDFYKLKMEEIIEHFKSKLP